MSVVADASAGRASGRTNPWLVVWIGALLLVLALYFARDWLPWTVAYPNSAKIPFDAWFSAAMAWLKTNITWLTRWVTAIFDVPLRFAFAILAKGYKIGAGPDAIVLPTLS